MSPIKIIYADDHPLCRYGFRRMVNISSFELIGEATNGKELLELAINLKPDIIITDIKMPVMDGIQATKLISKKLPKTGIIALSIVDECKLIMDMLDAGAKGYLLKSVPFDEIVEAVQTVYKGETYYCKDTTSQMIKILANNDYEIQKNSDPQFSQTEKDIIKLICLGFCNKEIATQLDIKKRTIEWHREQILHKISARNTAGIVAFAIKNKIC